MGHYINIKKQLTDLVQKYDLINRTYKYFWENYDNYLAEEPEEAHSVHLIDRSSVEKPFLRCVDYTLTSADKDNNFEHEILSVRLDFYHKEKSCCAIGHYTCEFSMSGEVEDDFFIID